MDNMINNRESLVYLKRRNPNIKIIAYSNPPDVFNSQANLNVSPLQKEIAEKIRRDMPEWFLKYPNGDQVLFWEVPGYEMDRVNFGTNCPEINGEKYYQYINR